MDVLVFSNIPAPYFVSYLRELSNYVNVHAVFEKKSASDRDSSWNAFEAGNVKIDFLKSISTGIESAVSFEIIKYIRQEKNSAIIFANPATPSGIIGILYCKVHSIPYILQSEGGIPKDGKGIKERFKYFLMHSASYYLSGMSIENEYFLTYGATADRVCRYPFTSLYEKDILKEALTPAQRIELRQELGINAVCMAIFVGQFIHRKAVDVLLKACKEVSDQVYVLIIGGIPTEEYLRIIRDYDLHNIHFSEFLDKETLIKYYKAADFFVLPTREDTWGLVINEAMAQGLPVITTRNCVAGVELIEDGENGYLIDVDDIEALSDKMQLLISNADLRFNMGRNNLLKIKEYTFENMAKVIANTIAYRRKLNGRK